MKSKTKSSFYLPLFCFYFCMGNSHELVLSEITNTKNNNPAFNELAEVDDELDPFGAGETDLLDDPNVAQYIRDNSFRSSGQEICPELLLMLFASAGATDLLQENIFCHTNPLNSRALTDLPLALPQKYNYPNLLMLGTNLFLNQTTRKNFTTNSTDIASYLRLDNPQLLKVLQKIHEADLVPGYDLIKILSLFKTVHIEERRIGTSFQLQWQSPYGDLRAFLPLYYSERNFNLGAYELDQLAALTFEPSLGEQERFKKEHLISDAIMLGELRLEWQLPLIDRENYALKIGLLTTLPTSWIIAKNINGSSYCPDEPRPTINLEKLCDNLSMKNTNKAQNSNNTLLKMLDHLSANLLDIKQNSKPRHFSIGGIIQSKAALNSLINRTWANNFTIHTRTSLEYFLPAWHKRFYVQKANPANFKRFDKYKEEGGELVGAEQDLKFLENRLVDVFYPHVFETLIKPHFVFWWNAKAQYEHKNIGGSLGLDFWLKGKERLGKIKPLKNICPHIEIKKVIKPLAYQMRAFGSVFFKMTRKNNEYCISINGDKTFLNSGIGKDYTIALQFEGNF